MDCPHIPELGYGEFGKQFRERVAGKRFPLGGSVELTFRCNLRCQHCYLDHLHNGVDGAKELTRAEWRNVFAQFADEGCLWLLLTGGEPLVRPDFLDIYMDAKRQGMIVTIFSNATLITPEIADYLAEWRPLLVEISVYGRTQDTYERITKVPGSHARCMQGIELLLERGIQVRLKTILMSLNKHEFWDMKAYAESLGLGFRFDPMINGRLDCSLEPTALRLTPEEIVEIELGDPRVVEGWKDFAVRYSGVKANSDFLYTCGAGLRGFHVDPYGQLSVCMLSRLEQYDLRQGTFAEGWRDFLRGVRFQPAPQDNDCSECELLSMCGQCPGWAEIETGTLTERVDFLCKTAHLRAQTYGISC